MNAGRAPVPPAAEAGRRVRRLLVVSDLAAIILGTAATLLLLPVFGRSLGADTLLPEAIVMLPAWVLIAFWFGLYHDFEARIDRSFVHEIGKVAVAVAIWNWLFIFLRALVVAGITELLPMAILWLMVVVLIMVGRSLVRRLARVLGWDRQQVALIGDEEGIGALADRFSRHPEWGMVVATEIAVEPETAAKWGGDGSGVGSWDRAAAEIAGEVTGRGANRAILAGGFTGFVNLSARTRLVQELVERGLAVDIVTGGPENLYSRATTQDVEGLPLISVQPSTVRPLALAIKRFFDLVGSILALVVFSPVMAWAAIRVKTGSRGPVFYRDPRVGRDDREFLAIKFRTMVEGADEMRPGLRDEADPAGEKVMFKLADDPRVTGVGRTLRVWSIDELPQLWNVVKGDMSLVGPRPLPPDEARRAEELFGARSRMRPGLAGPWQALGRSTIPFEEMVRLDYTYVTGWSMTEDLRLILRTLSSVLSRKGSM